MRLPPRGVCRFPGWHVLKLEFWHFLLPKVFSCLCRLSHWCLQCFGHLSTFCTCQLRLALVFQLFAGVWGVWGGRGDDVHGTATCAFFSFADLLLLGCGAVCRNRFGGHFRILVA